jgi:hypothetical protein
MGSTASLEIRKGEIVGFLNGRAVRLTAKPDELSGVAGGRVQLDIEEHEGKLEIGGTWNDQRVHFEISPDNLNGQITGDMSGRRWHCQYVLDKTAEDGARLGTSICSGLPEQTRLEFPKGVERWLTRGEAVAVLLALLASAPPTSTDFGPGAPVL